MAKKAQFLQISFRFAQGRKVKALEPVFSLGLDWMRLSDTSWIVWTTSNPQEWYARLRPHIDKRDGCFIIAIDVTQKAGQLYPWQWDWFKKHQQEQVAPPPSSPASLPKGPPRPRSNRGPGC